MSRGDRSADIPSAILAGIANASNTYRRWTLEDKWLCDAPELLVSAEIARKLKARFPEDSVDMEASVQQALSSAGASSRGRPREAERRHGRFDILLSRKSRHPWCAIEVKSPVGDASGVLAKDIERIRDVIQYRGKNGSSLSCGAVAFYSDRDKPKRRYPNAQRALEALGESSLELANTLIGGRVGITVTLHRSRFHRGNNDDGWQAFCLFFTMKRSRLVG